MGQRCRLFEKTIFQVGHLIEGSNLLNQVDDLWAPFAEGAKGWKYGPREIGKAGKLVEVNIALDQQAKLLEELRRHINNKVLQFFFILWFFMLVVISGISILVDSLLSAVSLVQAGGEGAQV